MNQRSLSNLAQCDERLQRIAAKAAEDGADFTVICGERGKADQDAAVARKASKTPFPHSRHNAHPSRAFDFIPGHGAAIDWNDIAAFVAVAQSLKAAAASLGIRAEYGGDWKSFKDYPHFQLSDSELWMDGQTCGLAKEPRA